ncbi:ECF transporter S component [Bifidobacterium aerophilum]|uniref:ECF transporter S component n=1 Tax=Bifidobacterium aerophilum TaxID=1798155 RepID=A0A6N9Z273_9BIFI|nr:ECF transporter S component [Bifidobacterium aerophilum]NEG88566.1 ECF transporter S component [Bifidobacterium aerophilum]
MKRGIRYDFSLLALLLIPVGVSMSVVGYQLSTILKFPIFIDQIGTVFVSMIGGPWVGLVTGLMGNVVNGMLNPVSFAYAFVSMIIGLVSGFLSRWKWYTNIFGTIAACFVLNECSATVAAVVTIFVFGGVTGAGSDLVTAAFLAAGGALVQSVLSTNLITGMAAMIIDVGVSWIILRRLPDRFLVKLNYGMPYVRNRKALA